MRFRNRYGETVAAQSFTATDAKNEFGRVLDAAIAEGAVVITKHEAPRAVLLSLDEYEALAGRVDPILDDLRAEFDALYESMQTPEAGRAMRAAFDATPEEMGRAAVAAARKRG
jgi:prevent-host-death family protein